MLRRWFTAPSRSVFGFGVFDEFSGAGFTDELHHLAKNDPTIQLIDLTRLYHGE
ncbi:hypothetical protein [Streptomyces sp. GESEQ-4]|uniref:hypothetical protein n=1 Tax=Streptomyces sp. GESEQ-4 TaxID=2812655 RepID=UPI001B344384|nr:hypothetical protein [Streptomyces sp. GESEQ-4]